MGRHKEMLMGRIEKFQEYCKQYEGKSFVGSNVSRVLQNLEKAVEDGCLQRFLMNEKPYISAFPFVGDMAFRGKDQVAIVIAMNLYGAKHPAFAEELNSALKRLIAGNTKQTRAVMVLMGAQMEFQRMDVALINFVDRELIDEVNRKTKKLKGGRIALWSLIGCASAMGAPGFAMAGLVLLSPICGVLCFYSIFIQVVAWVCTPLYKEEVIALSVRAVGPCEIEVE